MRKNSTLLMITTLVALIILTPQLTAKYGLAANAENDQDSERVDKLIQLFERANATLTMIFRKLEARGVTIPQEALENYDAGLEKAKQAVQLMEEGNYAEAEERILEAMQHLRNATLTVGDDLERVERPEEREARMAAGIEAAIERIQSRIERLREIAAAAEERGINASRIMARLGNLTNLLAGIKERIEAGNISEAAREKEMCQRWFGEAMANLRPIINVYKSKQAERFLDVAEKRLLRVSHRINEILSKMPMPEIARKRVVQFMSQGIEVAKNRIAQARGLLQLGKVNDAVQILSALRGDIADLMRGMKMRPEMKPEVGEALERIDLYEIALDILEKRAEILEEKGVDVTDLLAKIQEAYGLISEAVENLEKGELMAVEDLLTKIGEIVGEARSLADQLESEASGS
jgi:tetratricopeptide (TPR) repeat protein